MGQAAGYLKPYQNLVLHKRVGQQKIELTISLKRSQWKFSSINTYSRKPISFVSSPFPSPLLLPLHACFQHSTPSIKNTYTTTTKNLNKHKFNPNKLILPVQEKHLTKIYLKTIHPKRRRPKTTQKQRELKIDTIILKNKE